MNLLIIVTIAIFSTVFWVIAYILIIKRGFQDKTFGLPITAQLSYVSWEFIYTFIFPIKVYYLAFACFIFDAILVFQGFLYGQREFKNLPGKLFYIGFLAILFYVFYGLVLFHYAVGEEGLGAANISAFAMNMLCSALFIAMLLRRNNLAGQSIYIGLAKLLGTLCAFIVVEPKSTLLWYFYSGIFILDWAYIILFYNKSKELEINPWRHW